MDGFLPTFLRRKQTPPRWSEALLKRSARALAPPRTAIIPLQENPGTSYQCLVKAREEVVVGQKIGEMGKSPYALSVLATLSGKIREIDSYPSPHGFHVSCVVIDGDGREEISPRLPSPPGPEGGVELLLQAGIPLDYEKLSKKEIDLLLVNGTEFEPNIAATHQILQEMAPQVMGGIRELMRIFSIPQSMICVEKNQTFLIQTLREAAKDASTLSVQPVAKSYPSTGEFLLIQDAVKKKNGSSPPRVGLVDLALLPAVHQAVHQGIPFLERLISVSGSGVLDPGNVKVRIGTPFGEVITQCGGKLESLTQIVMGGVLMGISQPSPLVPVTWRTAGIMALVSLNLLAGHQSRMYVEGPCVRCAKCADACPVSILPHLLSAYCRRKRFAEAVEKGLFLCIDCGLCSYVCPARIPLAQTLREAKSRGDLRPPEQNTPRGNPEWPTG